MIEINDFMIIILYLHVYENIVVHEIYQRLISKTVLQFGNQLGVLQDLNKI